MNEIYQSTTVVIYNHGIYLKQILQKSMYQYIHIHEQKISHYWSLTQLKFKFYR